MNLWVAFPSYNSARAKEAAGRWHAQGYQPLVIVNEETPAKDIPAVVIKVAAYEGYYRSLNWACNHLFRERRADIVVCAGDRIHPPTHARGHDIALSCAAKFPSGFGIMQPVGNTILSTGHLPSPWICRRFYLEAYGGKGPFHERYFQFYGGDELGEVARAKGCVWYRDDITQPVREIEKDFIRAHNFKEYRQKDSDLFSKRKEEGFPGAFAASVAEPSRIILP